MSSHSRYIVRGASASFIIRVAGAFLGLVLQIVLANTLGTNEYGIYLYLWSWIALFSVFSRLGFESTLPRFLPVLRKRQEWGALKGTIATALLLPLGISALIAAAILVVQFVNQDSKDNSVFWVVGTAVPFFVLLPILRSSLLSFKQVIKAELPHNIIRPILFIVLLAILSYSVDCVTAVGAILTLSVSILIAIGVSSIWLVRVLPNQIWRERARSRFGELLSVSIPLVLMASFTATIGEFTIICLGWYHEPHIVAIYGACVRLSVLIAFTLQATNSVMNPLISELFFEDKRIELQAALLLSGRVNMLAAAGMFISLAISGRFILGLFGTEFIEGYKILLILLVAQFLNASAGCVGSIMKMTGHQKQACAILIVALVLHVFVCLALIPKFGAAGAVTASFIAIISWNGMMLVYVLRNQRLNPTAIRCLLRAPISI